MANCTKSWGDILKVVHQIVNVKADQFVLKLRWDLGSL